MSPQEERLTQRNSHKGPGGPPVKPRLPKNYGERLWTNKNDTVSNIYPHVGEKKEGGSNFCVQTTTDGTEKPVIGRPLGLVLGE